VNRFVQADVKASSSEVEAGPKPPTRAEVKAWIEKEIADDPNWALTPHVIAYYMHPNKPDKMPTAAADIRGPAADSFTRTVVKHVKGLYAAGDIKAVRALGGKVGRIGWNRRPRSGKKKEGSIFKGGRNPDILFYAPRK
jgi:hypothetical protein